MKNTLVKLGIALGLSLFLTWVYFFSPQSLFSFDYKLRDLMFNIRGELPKNNHVVIIDIDNRSLQAIGQWPWSRDILSSLIENLTTANAGIIGLDMVFSEKDSSSPHLLLKKFPQIQQTLPNYDLLFADTLAHSPVVGGFVFTENDTLETRTPLIPAVFIEKGLRNNNFLHQIQGIVLNTPLIQDALYTSGFFMINHNEGGVVRSVPLVQKYKDVIYPSLAFEMLRVYSNAKKVEIVGDTEGIQYIHLSNYIIPTDSSGEFIVNFRGPKKHFTYISAVDILNNKFNPSDIKNKFVLIGTSAPGLKDLRYISYDSTFPGVEIHANVIDNLLEGDYLQRPLITKLYDIALIWVIVFLLMFVLHYIRSWLILPIAIILFALLFYSLYILLFQYGFVLTILTPLLAFFMTLTLSTIFDYLLASRQKEEIKRILGKKVSMPVMQQLLKYSDTDLIQSKELQATIFFSDIRDFTNLSEKLGSPEKLIKLLNTYMTPMTEIIIEKKGTIDKFIGDAIMAYWNIPVPTENHADLAVSAAIKQIEQLDKVNIKIFNTYGIHINIGIGLHTGLVTAGEMGSTGRSDYTIIGDSVNLTSRIEGLTRLYGVEILISEETYSQLVHSYTIRPIDIVQVKGKENAIRIYQVIPSTKPFSKEELSLHQKALTLFQENHIEKSYQDFKKLNDLYPSTLYKHFITRCEKQINRPEMPFTPILKRFDK